MTTNLHHLPMLPLTKEEDGLMKRDRNPQPETQGWICEATELLGHSGETAEHATFYW